MNFTKEYIKECDCREIQGLRKEELNKGDYAEVNYDTVHFTAIAVQTGRFYNTSDYYWRHQYIWLPTSGQLDDEIVKICIKENYYYDITRSKGDEALWEAGVGEWADEEEGNLFSEVDHNPLIAKIKLLKQLLDV